MGRGRENRGSRLFSLPIVPRVPPLLPLLLPTAIFIGIPSGSLYGGESGAGETK